ncbi:hypothetical protein [Rugamonas aquatica]|uniref:Uncharacterized protein n=1 Tax=Rugamonas aquatica TaxID=2743357 RepID=A0A6A7N9B8_9BURK|nr:hypothetical protein [Rugamonas aquatica]MQA41663.1 hypothetical protein [Rugamonas aquatica]
MNWPVVVDGLLYIGSWMLGSMTVAIFCAWAIPRFFPRKPEDDYTYVLKNKHGKKTTVVLPPDLPDAEQQQILDEAYRRLGINPESGH